MTRTVRARYQRSLARTQRLQNHECLHLRLCKSTFGKRVEINPAYVNGWRCNSCWVTQPRYDDSLVCIDCKNYDECFPCGKAKCRSCRHVGLIWCTGGYREAHTGNSDYGKCFNCDICKVQRIAGPSWWCQDCGDYDVCNGCMQARKQSCPHKSMYFSEPELRVKSTNIPNYQRFVCNKCKQTKDGSSWWCLLCRNYDCCVASSCLNQLNINYLHDD